MRLTGAQVWRVGFNQGDRAFWPHSHSYIPFQEPQSEWSDFFGNLIVEKGITDIALYGDTRPVHAQAIEIAKENGITVHVFEEGYLRPYWVTYERNGSNGNSALMHMDVTEMQEILAHSVLDIPEAPAHWGDMRQHILYGALYHWFVMFRNGPYRNFRAHRALPVTKEFQLYIKRLFFMPLHWADRVIATTRIKWSGVPYHVALLQLEHDSSFQMHSPFKSMSGFLEVTIEGFAKGAPQHHHLVFKAHPLENGQVPLRRKIRELSKESGIENRVHYVKGGKLAQLLDHARSAVTVNSTSAQQVLWRGLPLKTFGVAVFDKPEFVSTQPLSEFFKTPVRPNNGAYKDYRHFLLETSQIAGGFYSARGRRQLLRQVVDMILSPLDPYEALKTGKATPRQQLRLVK